jgi:hypothetical protein
MVETRLVLKTEACRGARGGRQLSSRFVLITTGHPKKLSPSNPMTEGSSTPLVKYIIAQRGYSPQEKHCRSIVHISEECLKCFSSQQSCLSVRGNTKTGDLRNGKAGLNFSIKAEEAPGDSCHMISVLGKWGNELENSDCRILSKGCFNLLWSRLRSSDVGMFLYLWHRFTQKISFNSFEFSQHEQLVFLENAFIFQNPFQKPRHTSSTIH